MNKDRELFINADTMLKYGIIKAYIISYILSKGAYVSNTDCLARELSHVACFGHAKQSINELIKFGILNRTRYDGRTVQFSVNKKKL